MGTVTEDKIKQKKDWLKFPNLLSPMEKKMIKDIDLLINRSKNYNPITIIYAGREEKKEVKAETKTK